MDKSAPKQGNDEATRSEVPFAVRVAQLVSDPAFCRLREMDAQPNMFRAVGRCFTETWHSAFLGWLLDPEGSHNLGLFPLRRLLTAVCKEAVGPDAVSPPFLSVTGLAEVAAVWRFDTVQVLPNERVRSEKQIQSKKRLDVWIDATREMDEVDEEDAAKGLYVAIEVVRGLTMRYPHILHRLRSSAGPSGRPGPRGR